MKTHFVAVVLRSPDRKPLQLTLRPTGEPGGTLSATSYTLDFGEYLRPVLETLPKPHSVMYAHQFLYLLYESTSVPEVWGFWEKDLMGDDGVPMAQVRRFETLDDAKRWCDLHAAPAAVRG